jgi:hypothetical protein
LWQGYESLSTSDTTSEVERDALINQIEGAMTAEQIQAIDAMDLTNQSVSEVIQSMGANPTEMTSTSNTNGSALSQAAPAGGPGGMPGDTGDSVINEIGNGIAVQSTPNMDQSAENTQTSQLDVRLLAALIQMLETKSQANG